MIDKIGSVTSNTKTATAARTTHTPRTSPTAAAPTDAFSGSVTNEDPTAALRSARASNAVSSTNPVIAANPVVGTRSAAPPLTAGPQQSPVFLGNEAAYFKEANNVISNAKPGDMLCAQMYEFENAATNSDPGATQSPGYKDQQAILPGLAAAAARGVKVNVILDASSDPKTKTLNNAPIANYLKQAAAKTGNITVDYYPPNVVNIDHAKELVHLTPNGKGGYQTQEALAGGSNWGNHTPANDDGGGAFYGPDAMGPAQIFFRDQAFCRGDSTSPASRRDNGTNQANPGVQWETTSPTAEGGGATGIKQAKLSLTQQANSVYLNEFCLNQPDLVQATAAKGANAHVRLDPNEKVINQNALNSIRAAGGQAEWANTTMDPNMPGQKNHEKLDVYANAQGQPFALTIGSANDTGSGLNTTSEVPNPKGGEEMRKTNHEIDAVVKSYTNGSYSTVPFLQAALAKTQNDLATRSLENPPSQLSSTQPAQS